MKLQTKIRPASCGSCCAAPYLHIAKPPFATESNLLAGRTDLPRPSDFSIKSVGFSSRCRNHLAKPMTEHMLLPIGSLCASHGSCRFAACRSPNAPKPHESDECVKDHASDLSSNTTRSFLLVLCHETWSHPAASDYATFEA